MKRFILSAFVSLFICQSHAQSEQAPYYFIEGNIPADWSPDGNSAIFEDGSGLIVIDTGRHVAHSDKILAYSIARKKPINAIINTHWHLDHSSGNARIRAKFPNAELYASTAVQSALKGFLRKNESQSRALLNDPATPEERKAAIRLYLNTIEDPNNLIPNHPVTETTTIKMQNRNLELHLAKNAATEGDVWIYEPQSATVIAGDLVVVPFPFFDTACASGWKTALNEMAKTPFKTLIPGHGAPMPRDDFEQYRNTFNEFIDCSLSDKPSAACAGIWMSKAQKFVATYPNQQEAAEFISEYIEQYIRSADKQKEYCQQ